MNKLSICAIALSLTTSFVGAQQSAFDEGEVAKNDSREKYRYKSRYDMDQKKSCRTLPKFYKEYGVTIGGEFLYWQYTNEFAGEYVFTSLIPPVPATVQTTNGNNGDVDWEWAPGFRAYLGYNLNHDVACNQSDQLEGWDMFWIYTWNHWNSDGEFPEVGFQATLSPYVTSTTVTATNGWSKVQYNEDFHIAHLDYEIGRNYFLSNFINFRPHWGMRGALYKQQIHVTLPEARGASGETFYVRSFNTDDISGIGMKLGLDSNWYMARSWSFIANVNLAYLYSRHHLSQKTTRQSSTNGQVVNPSKGTRTLHMVLPQTEMRLGLQWDDWFGGDSWRTVFSACWEFIYMYEGTAQIIDTNAIQRNSPTIHGLTLNLGFQF